MKDHAESNKARTCGFDVGFVSGSEHASECDCVVCTPACETLSCEAFFFGCCCLYHCAWVAEVLLYIIS